LEGKLFSVAIKGSGRQTFPEKGQIVNTLGFVGTKVIVTTNCLCSMTAAIDKGKQMVKDVFQ
jgi:hypothetical protein